MKQKLIMENWRKFLNENKEQQVLDEGLLAPLAGLVFVIPFSGEPEQLDVTQIYDAAQTAQSDGNEEVTGELYNLLKDASANVKNGTLTKVDSNNDGVEEINPFQNSFSQNPLSDKAQEYLLGQIADISPGLDTGDTGVPGTYGSQKMVTPNMNALIKNLSGLVKSPASKAQALEKAQNLLDNPDLTDDQKTALNNIIAQAN